VRCFYNEKLSDNWRKFYYYKKEKEKYDLENNVRILDISDLHIPFNLPIEVYKKYIGKVDILVINGDLIDCYAMSKFTKMFRQPLIDELIKAREFCIELVNLIKPKKVIVVSGNHEIRLGKQIADKIGTDLLDLLPTDAMAFLFDTGFNHHNHQTKVKTVYTPLDEVFAEIGIECIYANNFWYKVGKTIFVHPLAFKSNDLATVVKAYEYFTALRENFDCVVMAHTHRLGYTNHNGVHLYEQGCMADLNHMDYMDLKLPKTLQTNGCLYLVQDSEGNLVYEKTKLDIV
jgi:predicted MPP superfamily phosphohydrolase